jgi:hypothetical protein
MRFTYRYPHHSSGYCIATVLLLLVYCMYLSRCEGQTPRTHQNNQQPNRPSSTRVPLLLHGNLNLENGITTQQWGIGENPK